MAVCLSFLSLTPSMAQTSDNGDGTFMNPVIWGDFPDPDVIRVGDTFYFVSTSMHYFPGVTILQSKDLVNWSIACNVVNEFKEHPGYDLDGGNRYAKGQWATSLKYFDGKFHALFTTLGEGSFIYTAEKITGPWTKHKVTNAYLYDPGMFVDTDGRLYVVSGNTNILVTELDKETLQAKGPQRQIYKSHRPGLEGNRCYHIGNYYYIYCTYGAMRAGETCLRSKSLYGPFEERTVMGEAGNYNNLNYIHQSCLIDMADGTYWGMLFQDRGGLGRLPFLVPVYWADEWPILGNPMDGVMRLKKPIQGQPATAFPSSDEFDSSKLNLHWQFNHNPDKSKYSLTERKGFLRLHTATLTDSLLKARNTICQRILGPYSEATVSLDISKMKRGDRAGFVVLQDPFATLCIERTAKGNILRMTINEEVKASTKLKGNKVYLRAQTNGVTDKVKFFFSCDGKSFLPLGEELHMNFNLSIFCGNRYGIFNYATQSLGGYIDVDWIRVKHSPLFDRTCNDGKILEAEWYDHQYFTETIGGGFNSKGKGFQVLFHHDGGQIAFNDLVINEPGISSMELSVKAQDIRQAFIEVRNADTGIVLATVETPKNSTDYETLKVPFTAPLTSCHRVEIRFWNHSGEGSLTLDKIVLKK